MRQYIDIVETKKPPNKLMLERLPYKISDLATVLSRVKAEYKNLAAQELYNLYKI